MTVTDEDRKAARAVWIQAAFDYGGQSIPGEGEERAARVIADFIADTRQAAYAAGLERAAVIAEEEKFPISTVIAADRDGDQMPDIFNDACTDIATAIRAEKDKP
jgi:hypothetical protein